MQLLHLFYLWDLANYNHHLDDTMICSTGNNLNQNKTCFTFLLQSIFSAILFHYSSNGLWKMDCSLRTSWRNEQKLIHNGFSTHAHLRYFVSSWDWSWLQSLPKNLLEAEERRKDPIFYYIIPAQHLALTHLSSLVFSTLWLTLLRCIFNSTVAKTPPPDITHSLSDTSTSRTLLVHMVSYGQNLGDTGSNISCLLTIDMNCW